MPYWTGMTWVQKTIACFDVSLTLTPWFRNVKRFNAAAINNMIIQPNGCFVLRIVAGRLDQFHNKIATGMKLEITMEGKQADDVHMVVLLCVPSALIAPPLQRSDDLMTAAFHRRWMNAFCAQTHNTRCGRYSQEAKVLSLSAAC